MKESDWKEHLEQILETIADGAMLINPDGCIAFANASAERISGSKRSDLIGHIFNDPSRQLATPDGKPLKDEACPFLRVMKTGKPVYGIEISGRRPDGTRVIMSFNAAPLRDKNGAITNVVETFNDITDRKQTEKRLNLFFEAVEEAPDGVQITDLKGYIIYSNRAVEKIYGFSPGEYIGKHVAEMNKDPEFAEKVIIPGIKNTGRWDGEVTVKHKDGRVFPIWLTTSVVKNSHNNPVAFVGFIRDITGRKMAEEALRESEERFRRLSEATFEGIVIHEKGKILEANHTLAGMFGYELDELIGKSGLDLLTPESQEIVSGHILYGSEEPYEAVGIKKDGTTFPLEIRGKTSVYENRFVRVGAIRDITERRLTEEALKQSEEKYRTMIEFSNDMIWTLDTEGLFQFFNKRAEDITGYKLEDWRGKTFVPVIVEEDLPKVAAVFQKTLSGKPQQYEVRIKSQNGRIIVLSVNTAPIYLKGKIAGTVSFGRDITEQKKSEEALRDTDLAIRKAYVDVIGTVTGGRLIIATHEEVIASLGEPVTDTCRIILEDIAPARVKLREIIRHQFPGLDIEDIIIAAGEAITNAIKHAGGGEYRVYKTGNAAQILISDYGPGIDFETLPKATLVAGFSTKPSLGLGFTMMLELTDRILLSTRPGNTIIVLEKL
ncbi:MAG: PAS domain S-box protein [Firmicutes bacterium]|nr:PAS domain S-box protein [Bacillota bacterium]